jgi:amino acid adenylation domain-containing protein
MTETATEGFPLSVQQRRIWAAGPEGAQRLRALLLEGELDTRALRESLGAVVERHEILRTTFQRAPGLRLPLQVISRVPAADLNVLDVNGDASRAAGEVLEATSARLLAEHSFDPGADRPLRAWLVPLSRDAHGLVVSVPALCADEPSLDLIVDELAAGYAAARRGERAEWPDPVQYADFAGWQESQAGEQDAAEAQEFWRRRREAARAALRHPFDAPGSPAAAGGRATVRLSGEQMARVEAESGARGLGPADFIAACWHALLWRFEQPGRVAVEHVLDGRPLDELAGAVGPYAQPVPVVSAPEPGMPFERLLAQLVDELGQASRRQGHYGLGDGGEDPRPGPVWQFEWRARRTAPRWDGLDARTVRELAVADPRAIRLRCEARPEGLDLALEYDPAELEPQDAQRLLGWLVELVGGALERPATEVDRLPLMSAGAREQALASRPASEPVGDAEAATFHAAVERQAELTPDAVAVEFRDDSLTYAELVASSRAVAAALAERGLAPDGRVGICLERSTASIVAILGAMLAGGCYVPLDPDHPPRYARRILADAQAQALITQPSLEARFADAEIPTLSLDPRAPLPPAGAGRYDPPSVGPDAPAYAIYTSGSTGAPKGVMISHRSVMALARALGATVFAGEGTPLRASVNAPFTFDASVKQLVLLTAGHTVHVLPEDIRLDAHGLSDHLEHRRVDVLDCTPSQLRPLLHAIDIHDERHYPRIVLVGGEPMGEGLWSDLRARAGIETYNVYGPTETTVDATVASVRRSGATPTIGRALPGVQALVLDPGLAPVPPGVLGELCIGGWGVGRGYLGDPELTAASFVEHPRPARPGERVFRTGDLARARPDGTLEYVGRRDRQVKLRGFRVGLAEIEAALARHADVTAVAVVEVRTRAGSQRLSAHVVAPGRDERWIDDLRAHVAAELPEHMRPATYELCESLPVTAHGKVDLAALRSRASERLEASGGSEPPRTPTEKLLAEIWESALEAEGIGIHDDFFDAGGDSILQIMVVARAKERGLDLTPRDLFEHPTIAELATVADGPAGDCAGARG